MSTAPLVASDPVALRRNVDVIPSTTKRPRHQDYSEIDPLNFHES